MKPKDYHQESENNQERKSDISFQDMCNLLSDYSNNSIESIKKMCAFDFYSLLNYVCNKLNKNKKTTVD